MSHNPPSHEARWRDATRVGLLTLLIIAVIVAAFLGNSGNDLIQGPATPPAQTEIAEAERSPTPSPAPTHVPIAPTARPTIPATPTAAITAAGLPAEAITTLGADQCATECLVRIPNMPDVIDSLHQLGERPSYITDDWLWISLPRELIARQLDASTPTVLLQDPTQTWPLYIVRQREGTGIPPDAAALGDPIDSIGRYTVVAVPDAPPIIDTDFIQNHLFIEKLLPAPPDADTVRPLAARGSIGDVDPWDLLGQVDETYLADQLITLQGMSSTDGSGVGTRHYTQPGSVMAGEYLFTTMEAMGLLVWYEDFITWDGNLAQNVIGEIPGADDSMIYGVMAHYDSYNADDYSTAPGADDNGTGVSSALQIADILSQYELEHPVRMLFVDAEEISILGSTALAQRLVTEAVPIEGVFNIDTVGTPEFGNRLFLNSGPDSAWMSELLNRINDQYGLGNDIRIRQNPAIVADDNMLRNQGIEAILVARMLAGEYGVQHSPADVLDNLSLPLTADVCGLVLMGLAALVGGQ